MSGPYDTPQQVVDDLAATGFYATRTHPDLGAYLTACLHESGVDLGRHDERIVAWLTGTWEPHITQTVADWVRRANEAGRAG